MIRRSRGRRAQSSNRGCAVMFLGIPLFLLVLVLAFHRPILQGMAEYLIIDTGTLSPCDVAIALGGGRGHRVVEARLLYEEGLARRIIITGGDVLVPGKPGITWSDIMASFLEGSVPDSLVTLERRSASTYQDAIYTLEDLRALGARTVIVVTDPFHLRRTRAVFRRIYAGSGIEFHIWSPRETWFHSDRWWTSEAGLIAVVDEYLKILFYMYTYRIWPWS